VAPAHGAEQVAAALLPLLFVLFAATVGVYTRLRRARSRSKAAWLTASVLGSATVTSAAGADPSITTLWVLLTLPAVVLARVLVSVGFSERPFVTRVTRPAHGPVLVIGGAGYIGSLTVELLLQRGYKVRVLDRLMYGREPLAEFASNENFELIEGDATDIARLTAAARNTSAVIHLAGLVGDPACAIDADFTRHANIVATRMAKEVAQGLGVPRFIFASSCSVYGASDRLMREGDPLNPVSLYAQTKIDSEEELLEDTDESLCLTILRFATVFGYSRRPRFDLVANLLTAQAVREGEITVVGPDQWRPFIHVRDLARAIVMVLEADQAVVRRQIYNVGDDRLNMTIGELGETVRQTLSRHRQVRVVTKPSGDDRRNYHVSFEKIRRDLGFAATTLLEEGISEIADRLITGMHADFRAPVYSNYATTRAAVPQFRDPSELARMYAPLHRAAPRSRRTPALARAAAGGSAAVPVSPPRLTGAAASAQRSG
jgi:nucleoside-diphosphate-sugar epimerase